MSLILDALKKLEQERAGRRGKVSDLGPAIVASTGRDSGRRGYTIAITISAVVITAAATVLLMKFLVPGAPATTPAPPAPAPQAAQSLASPLPQPPPATPPEAPSPRPIPASPPAPEARAAAVKAEEQPAAAPQLKVSGIAWQEERAARRAVVNGTLIGEGNTVAGAVVREIHPDRVIFGVGTHQVEIVNSTPF